MGDPAVERRHDLHFAFPKAILGHNYIGTEHILLGLTAEEAGVAVPTRPDLDRSCEENEGVAIRVLQDLGVDAERIRNEVIRMLSSPEARAERARAQVTYLSSETSIHVNPSAIVHRLLMSGAARALDDGRSRSKSPIFCLLSPATRRPPSCSQVSASTSRPYATRSNESRRRQTDRA